jgi:hypothetical protein
MLRKKKEEGFASVRDGAGNICTVYGGREENFRGCGTRNKFRKGEECEKRNETSQVK